MKNLRYPQLSRKQGNRNIAYSKFFFIDEHDRLTYFILN